MSTQGEELKLLALVHDNFAENGPRLDYADWLDREGRSEEAELIRLQCAPASGALPLRSADPARLAVLLAKWEPLWRAGLTFLSPPSLLDRGFLCLRSSFYLDFERSDELSRAVAGMLGNRHLFWCQELRLGYSTGLEPGLTAKLATAPYASRVKKLILHELRLAPGELVEVLRLPSLTSLEIMGGISSDWGGAEYLFPSLTDHEVADLLASPHIGRLSELSLWHQSLSIAASDALRAGLPEHVVLKIDGLTI